MVKHRSSKKGYESGKDITTKSWFGSHTEMVVSEGEEGTPVVELKKDEVVCKDNKGYYITYKKHLDSGLADPNRCDSGKRL